MYAFALLLVLLLAVAPNAAVDADTAPVHSASVSVRSARSFLYHGMQVALFENNGTTGSGRYFFPPLALLDCASTRIVNNLPAARENGTITGSLHQALLQLTVLLWTDDFLSALQNHLRAVNSMTTPESAHVELVPLTELTVTWSRQTSQWIGKGYERKYQLLDGWIDAQKPRARVTFNVACNPTDCNALKLHLSDADGSAGHLFDLKYRIRCDSQKHISVPLSSSHLMQSPLFQMLRRFALKSSGIVLVSEATINQLGVEMRQAALEELQSQLTGDQRADSVDAEALAALLADAGRFLRRSPLVEVSPAQWAQRVYWQSQSFSSANQQSSGALCPDRIAKIFNRLLKPEASGRPRLVQPTHGTVEMLASLASEGGLPGTSLTSIRNFFATRSSPGAEPINVDEVCELASTLESPIAWDAASMRFVPSPLVKLFELNTGSLSQVGTFAVRDAVLRYLVSEQRDHVTPLCRTVQGSTDSEKSGTTQAELLRFRLQPLLARAENLSTSVSNLEAALATAKAETVPGGEVRERSADRMGSPENRRYSTEDLTTRIQILSDTISQMEASPTAASQGHFADHFCILANSSPAPKGMKCRTVSMFLPSKSLKDGILDQGVARIGTGTAGLSFLQPEGKNFYRLQLRGCCK